MMSEFNDEKNQHKLFMAFELSSVKEVNLISCPLYCKKQVLSLMRICLITARIM
jgi:hypothetical protein